MQGFPPAGGVLPKEKKAEIALIVLGIVQKKFRGLGPRCMCIYRKCSQYVGRPRSEFSGRRRGAGGGRRARIPAGFADENWEKCSHLLPHRTEELGQEFLTKTGRIIRILPWNCHP